MKLTIEVDLDPSEIPLASELLQILRSLTEHVKVKQRGVGSVAHSGLAPFQQFPHAVNGSVAVAAPAQAPPQAPVPASAAAGPIPSSTDEARHMFTQLIRRLGGPEGPSQLDAVAAEASRILGHRGAVPEASLFTEFNEALCAVAFDQSNIQRQQNVDAFLAILPRLPDPARSAVKQHTISTVLNFLNQKRPANVDRESVYLQADGFAVLVQLDFVAADGILQTLSKIMKTPGKHVAAVMTLCALVQRCRDKVASANPAFLESALSMLVSQAGAEHRPAVEYIFGQLGRPMPPLPAPSMAAPPAVPPVPVPNPRPASVSVAMTAPMTAPVAAPMAAPVAAPMAAPRVGLSPAPPTLTAQYKATFDGPSNTGAAMPSIFSLAYDPFAQLYMSGGLEVPVVLWSADGKMQHQLPVPNGFFVSNIHLEPQNRLMVVVGAANAADATVKGRVALYDAQPGAGYTNRGNVIRDDMISLAGVVTLPNLPLMLVAELVSGPQPNRVAMYDYNRVMQSGSADHQPLQCFAGHTDVVTAVATAEGDFKDCFLSASKDCTVMVWDTRTPDRAVAVLGVKEGDARRTHADMVTCVDVCGYSVMSASLDGSVALWDLRAADGTTNTVAVAANSTPCIRGGVTQAWNNNGIVKAAMKGAPHEKLVAAATVRGLYLVDMAQPVPVAKHLTVGNNDPMMNYCEIKWCEGTGQLLAASGQSPSFELLECRV